MHVFTYIYLTNHNKEKNSMKICFFFIFPYFFSSSFLGKYIIYKSPLYLKWKIFIKNNEFMIYSTFCKDIKQYNIF